MSQFSAAIQKGLFKVALTFSLIFLTSFCSLFIFFQQPSYALSTPPRHLSSQEKIDRAYEYSEATGLLEEDKQASKNANELFDYGEKANEKTVVSSQKENSDSNLIDQAQEAIGKAIGK
ncbi:MAG TPA: hypothetical protein V6D15_17460 [Oculatellaceae cyanobacterium]|jgi:hypothetical protein